MKNNCLMFSLLATSFLLSGCSTIPATPAGFEQKIVEGENINFVVWEKENIQPKETLRFYIEGNGTPHPKKAIALSFFLNTHNVFEWIYSSIIFVPMP